MVLGVLFEIYLPEFSHHHYWGKPSAVSLTGKVNYCNSKIKFYRAIVNTSNNDM